MARVGARVARANDASRQRRMSVTSGISTGQTYSQRPQKVEAPASSP